ncbi:hypothetical protein [Nocardioides sp. SYSU DS0651]|uniref:hypothetical protein n=1 Tax=Nocardioides sp. SYSU DS0651 TaxID=3415955 RepID=UPI003F4B02A5
MRRCSLLLFATLLGASALPALGGEAVASCAAPALLVPEGAVLERGATVTVAGEGFVDGCQDSMGCEVRLGCDSCEYAAPPPAPYRDETLALVQQGREWVLGVEDARPDGGEVTWSIEVPRDVAAGPATLRTDHGEPVRVQVGPRPR